MDWSKPAAQCLAENNVATLQCIPAFFSNIVYWALILTGITALFVIIWAGLKFILSGADPKRVEEARHMIRYAITGLILVLASFLIINLIATITGARCIEVFGFKSCG